MSKSFKGQSTAPAPPQGPNQSVNDRPGPKSRPVLKPPTDNQHYTQKSADGNDGHSGLPIKSDGKYRDSSDLKQKK